MCSRLSTSSALVHQMYTYLETGLRNTAGKKFPDLTGSRSEYTTTTPQLSQLHRHTPIRMFIRPVPTSLRFALNVSAPMARYASMQASSVSAPTMGGWAALALAGVGGAAYLASQPLYLEGRARYGDRLGRYGLETQGYIPGKRAVWSERLSQVNQKDAAGVVDEPAPPTISTSATPRRVAWHERVGQVKDGPIVIRAVVSGMIVLLPLARLQWY